MRRNRAQRLHQTYGEGRDPEMRLLLVEDDTALADALRAALDRRGIASDHATTASDAGQMLTAARYAALVLDIGLPDRSGIEVLRDLRARHDPIPVILLTARGEIGDRIEGLDAGADDYLVKPFAVEELVARLKAVLRRQGAFQGSVLSFANLRFDTDSRDVLADDRPSCCPRARWSCSRC